MKLKSFGCSFVFGIDLADVNDGGTQLLIQPSNSTWPAHIAQHLEYEYECFAWGGLGNLQILERVLSQASTEPALFVVNWTWIDRFDYAQAHDNCWTTIRPTCTSDQAEYYYRHFHSQYRDKLTTLIMIKLAIDTLQQHGHQIIMTYMDDLIFETEWHVSPAVIDLQNYIKPHMTNFEGKNFLDWSRKKGHAISDTWHPLEDAHAAAADYLINQGLL
jgi:hypothetical protein